ncbi:MAG: hypothetical protein ACUVUE_01715, partial [Candidatus Bathycorpusculaceae bacterium]
MEIRNYQYGICGVYCGQCPNGNGRVKMTAGELKSSEKGWSGFLMHSAYVSERWRHALRKQKVRV